MMKRARKRIKRGALKYLYLLIIFVVVVIFYFFNKNKTDLSSIDFSNSYNEFVITNKEAKIYKKEDGLYLENGIIGKNVELRLNEDSKNEEYFSINNLDNKYYIKYEDVDKIDKLTESDSRYKNYILFNYNVETSDKTSFYDNDNNLIYSLNEAISLPLIVKDTDRYGVEFDGKLLYIKKDEAILVENENTSKHNASGVGVLNYHAFYDENDPDDSCPTEICHSKAQFEEQLTFLRDNNIFTVKMKELEYYIDGKINLPKSVLITIDDGGRDRIAVDMLTQYKMNATIFLITGWYDAKTYYKTDYIELHSHGHNLHQGGECPGGQGGAIKCLDKNKLQEDLKKSREALNGSTSFAYPFYEYNSYAIDNLKEAGFTMAFIGESNNADNLVHVGDDKFKLRRFVIVTYTTINDLKKYFGQIK